MVTAIYFSSREQRISTFKSRLQPRRGMSMNPRRNRPEIKSLKDQVKHLTESVGKLKRLCHWAVNTAAVMVIGAVMISNLPTKNRYLPAHAPMPGYAPALIVPDSPIILEVPPDLFNSIPRPQTLDPKLVPTTPTEDNDGIKRYPTDPRAVQKTPQHSLTRKKLIA